MNFCAFVNENMQRRKRRISVGIVDLMLGNERRLFACSCICVVSKEEGTQKREGREGTNGTDCDYKPPAWFDLKDYVPLRLFENTRLMGWRIGRVSDMMTL